MPQSFAHPYAHTMHIHTQESDLSIFFLSDATLPLCPPCLECKHTPPPRMLPQVAPGGQRHACIQQAVVVCALLGSCHPSKSAGRRRARWQWPFRGLRGEGQPGRGTTSSYPQQGPSGVDAGLFCRHKACVCALDQALQGTIHGRARHRCAIQAHICWQRSAGVHPRLNRLCRPDCS